jgi:hypothetical protein
VAWPQCWFPATLAVGLSIELLVQVICGRVRRVLTLVVEMVGAVFIDEHAIGIVHETLRRAKVNLGSESAIVIALDRHTSWDI